MPEAGSRSRSRSPSHCELTDRFEVDRPTNRRPPTGRDRAAKTSMRTTNRPATLSVRSLLHRSHEKCSMRHHFLTGVTGTVSARAPNARPDLPFHLLAVLQPLVRSCFYGKMGTASRGRQAKKLLEQVKVSKLVELVDWLIERIGLRTLPEAALEGIPPRWAHRALRNGVQLDHALERRNFNFRTSGSIGYSGTGLSRISTDRARS